MFNEIPSDLNCTCRGNCTKSQQTGQLLLSLLPMQRFGRLQTTSQRPPRIIRPRPLRLLCQCLLHQVLHRASRTHRPRAPLLPPHGREAGRCGIPFLLSPLPEGDDFHDENTVAPFQNGSTKGSAASTVGKSVKRIGRLCSGTARLKMAMRTVGITHSAMRL